MLIHAIIIRCNACPNELRLEGKHTSKQVKAIVELSGWEWHVEENVHYCFLHGALGRMQKNGTIEVNLKGVYRKEQHG